MPVSEPLFEGVKYTIFGWLDEEGHCATKEFMAELNAKNNPDAASFVNRLSQTASHGPPASEDKFRYIKGKGKGLVEFKARGGSRILAFIDKDRRWIICTHGIPKLKQKRFDREVDKALNIMELYRVEFAVAEGDYVN